MSKYILMNAEVRRVVARESKDHKTHFTTLTLEVLGSYDEVSNVEMTDFDEKNKYVMGQKIVDLPVSMEMFNGKPVFHPIKSNGNKSVEEKKNLNVKV